ncbi:unnamed protein product [Dicrocoelium dendriticum]|nr:unnamed protein product [Dicrocoelium dendriticum]
MASNERKTTGNHFRPTGWAIERKDYRVRRGKTRLVQYQAAKEDSEPSSEQDMEETEQSVAALSKVPHPDPNIRWPTIEEFNQDLGLKSMEECIKGWQLEEPWLHCTDAISVEDATYEKLYRYRVRWSIPTRRAPIPRATASVYFTIEVSKVKPKNHEVDVYYQLETFRTKHRPGSTRFSEKWLHDLIASKARLMLYVNF